MGAAAYMVIPPLKVGVISRSPGPMNCKAAGEDAPTFLFTSSSCNRIRLETRLPCLAFWLPSNDSLLDSRSTSGVAFTIVITFTRFRIFRTGSFASSSLAVSLALAFCSGTFRCRLRNIILHLTTFPKRCRVLSL